MVIDIPSGINQRALPHSGNQRATSRAGGYEDRPWKEPGPPLFVAADF